MIKQNRILLLCGNLSFAGAQRQLFELAKNLDRRKYEVFVCSISSDVQIYDELKSLDINLYVIGRKFRYLPFIIRDVAKYLRSNQIDVIYPFLFEANFVARIAGFLAGTSVVLSSERSSNYESSILEKTFERITENLYEIVITNSFAGKNFLLKCKKTKDYKIRVIANGIDSKKYVLTKNVRAKIREELGISDDTILIGMIARIKPAKNFPMLFEVAKKTIKQYDNVCFVSVGDHSYGQEEYYKYIMKSYNSFSIPEEKFIFAGKRRDIPALLSALDISLLTSSHEGFPNAVIESMASGLPVVSTSVGDVPRIIEENLDGYIVPVNDVNGMVKNVTTLIESPVKRREMGKLARDKILKNYSIEKMVNNTDSIIQELLEKKIYHD